MSRTYIPLGDEPPLNTGELDLLHLLRPLVVKEVAAMPDKDPFVVPVDPPHGSYSPPYQRQTGIEWQDWHRDEAIRTARGVGNGLLIVGLAVFAGAALAGVVLGLVVGLPLLLEVLR